MAELGLRKAATTAFFWNVAGAIVRAGAGFAVNILLARLLGPEPFGVLAIVLVIVSLSNLVIDSGLTVGLIQRPQITDDDVRYVFTWQVLTGLMLAIILVCLARPLAAYFQQPALVPIMPWVALSVVLQALWQASGALLRRQFNYRALQAAQIVSYLLGYVGVAVPLALAGAGVWSLIAAQVVQGVVNTLLVLKSAPHSLRPLLQGDRSLLAFGSRVLGANVANWLLSSLDTVLIARSFSANSLGVYNRINFLISTPVGIPVGAAQGVLLSGVSRVQDDLSKVRSTYLGVIHLIAFATWPILAGAAALSETLVRTVYGDAWTVGKDLLPPLAVACGVSAISAMAGPVLASLGRADLEFRQTLYALFIGLPVLIIGSRFDLTTLAWLVALSRLVFMLCMLFPLLGILRISAGSIIYPLGRALMVSVLLGFVLSAVDASTVDTHPVLKFCLFLGCGAAVYALTFVLAPKAVLSREGIGILENHQLFGRLARFW